MHTCPECLHICKCNGDIDDLVNLDTEGSDNCRHCIEDFDEDDDGDFAWFHDQDMGAR